MATGVIASVAALSLICAVAGDENVFEKEARKLRTRLGPDFRVAVEKPFIVAGDQSEENFRRSREHTIRWSVRLLKQDFFAKDPPRPLVIYLFDGKDSYHAHAKMLFGEEPDTQYGYYSRAHGALIMNIATGGVYPADAIPTSWYATTGPGNSFPGTVANTIDLSNKTHL